MKKLYLLLAASVLLCGTAMAQFSIKATPDQKFCKGEAITPVKHAKNMQKDEATPLWECDFEADGYTLTEGNDAASGKDHWKIVTLSTFPSALADFQDGTAYFQPFIWHNDTLNDTPEHWAMIDLLSDHAQFGGNGQVAEEAWMQFSMDLSSSTHPKICFKQLYRPLNRVSSHVKVSIDGGATWTDHLINDEIASNDYAPVSMEVIITEAAGQDNVLIRFQQSAEGAGLQGYGWQVDDIKVVETPQYDLTIGNGRMNFWGYKDYTDPQVLAEYTGTMDPVEFYYQNNDPYAQTPRSNWVNAESEWNGYIVFNVELTNNGYETITPKANVKITSPSGDVIFDRTLAGKTTALTDKDTIDFYTEDADIFTFDVTSAEQIEIGRYTVTFSVFADDAEDATPDDNEAEYYFDITEKNYSMVYDEPDRSFGMCNYQGSASGDEVAEYLYYFALPDDEIEVDVFISDRSAANKTRFQIKMYEINEDGDLTQVAASDLTTTTEAMLGAWTTVKFQDPFYIDAFDTNYKSKTVLVSVVSHYDTSDDGLYFGSTDKLPSFHHNVLGKQGGEEDWGGYGYSPVALRIHTKNETAVESVSMADVNMYPNPTSGIINFSNVENATIEVINMMGQVVANVENATENTTIDLSGVANGNYIVRVVKNGNVATSKLNIVK